MEIYFHWEQTRCMFTVSVTRWKGLLFGSDVEVCVVDSRTYSCHVHTCIVNERCRKRLTGRYQTTIAYAKNERVVSTEATAFQRASNESPYAPKNAKRCCRAVPTQSSRAPFRSPRPSFAAVAQYSSMQTLSNPSLRPSMSDSQPPVSPSSKKMRSKLLSFSSVGLTMPSKPGMVAA